MTPVTHPKNSEQTYNMPRNLTENIGTQATSEIQTNLITLINIPELTNQIPINLNILK